MLTSVLVLLARVRALFDRRRSDAEFDDEIATHLSLLTDDYRRRGLTPAEARRGAALRFGGAVQLKERQREQRRLPLVDATLQDVRYAVRSLRRHPAFTIVAVLTLAVGIAAPTAMFTVADAVLLRPLPYPEPDRLIEITEINPLKAWTHTVVAPANLADWRTRNTVFIDIAGYIGLNDRGASHYRAFLSGAGETQALNGIAVTGNLFDVLGTRPLAGRTFSFAETFEGRDGVVVLSHGTWRAIFGAHDGPTDLVIVVNESLARTYFRGGSPLGQRLKFANPDDPDPWNTIVGMVADEKQDGLDKDTRPEAYSALTASSQNPLTFVVRSTLSDDAVVAAARETVRGFDPQVAITDVAPLSGVVAAAIGGERFRATLIGAFGGVAMFLAALGIYGVLGYIVSQRARELGIRLALGARPQELFAMVVRQGMRPVMIGTAAGVAAALALTRLLASVLFGVRPADPATYAVSLAALAAIALTACALPAIRATRVDPLVALHED